jgi:uncharacterized protein (TIGR00251 family)
MSTAPLSCIKAGPKGCELLVQVVPNASRTQCAGLHDGALRLRLAAPPIEGRANTALVQWVAQQLGLPRRAVTLSTGDTSRRKKLLIDGDPAAVAAWVQAQLAAAAAPE